MKKTLTIVTVFLLLFLCYLIAQRFSDGKSADGLLHIYMLDVGQGDSGLIITPSGKKILIDAGPANHAIIDALAEELPRSERSIDMTIATHPDMDHIGGFVDVLKRYSVGTMIDNGVSKPTPEAMAWRSAELAETESTKGSSIQKAYRGQRFDLGDGVDVKVLHPDKKNQYPDTNNNSVTLRLQYGNISALFTGDMDAVVEMDMMQNLSKEDLDIDILKVAHHGSKYSSSLSFLRRTSPQLALISVVCKNDYGHPHEQTLRRYKYLGIPIMTTCDRGTIEIVSDGKEFWVQK